jgi:membrane dipeptidase
VSDLHKDALIIDGLNFHGDGDPVVLRDAGITAVNLTVSHFEADFEQTMDGMAGWLAVMNRPDSGWRKIESVSDIEACHGDGKVGLIMGWQNLRPIADKLDRLVLMKAVGLRVAQLTYNRRNFLGDGCLEPEDGGMSAMGGDAVRLMNELGIAIDLSHVGQRTSVMAAEASRKPVLATHANARSVTPALRNKSDDAIRAIAATGGVIGVSNYGPMCWDGDPSRHPSLDDFERHLDFIVDLVGVDHVGLGTDMPAVADLDSVAHITKFTLGTFPAAIAKYAEAFSNDIRARYLSDCASHQDLSKITERLQQRGWDDGDILKFLGGNFLRAFGEIWCD